MDNKEIGKANLSLHRITFGGSSGAMFIAIVQLLSVAQLDMAQCITVFCFSVSLPIFVIHFMDIEKCLIEGTPSNTSSIAGVFVLIGMILGVVGFVALFWHFHWLASMTFFCVSLLFIISKSKK